MVSRVGWEGLGVGMGCQGLVSRVCLCAIWMEGLGGGVANGSQG